MPTPDPPPTAGLYSLAVWLLFEYNARVYRAPSGRYTERDCIPCRLWYNGAEYTPPDMAKLALCPSFLAVAHRRGFITCLVL
jgi:hypothetical protein